MDCGAGVRSRPRSLTTSRAGTRSVADDEYEGVAVQDPVVVVPGSETAPSFLVLIGVDVSGGEFVGVLSSFMLCARCTLVGGGRGELIAAEPRAGVPRHGGALLQVEETALRLAS